LYKIGLGVRLRIPFFWFRLGIIGVNPRFLRVFRRFLESYPRSAVIQPDLGRSGIISLTATWSLWPPGAIGPTLSGRPSWFTRTVILLVLYFPALEIWSPFFCHQHGSIQMQQAQSLQLVGAKPLEESVKKPSATQRWNLSCTVDFGGNPYPDGRLHH